MRSLHDRRGFTLIELLVVIGVIAVLAAVLVPNLLSSRKTANEKAVVSSMKSVSGAEAMYYTELDGRFASLTQLETGGYLGLGVRNRVLTAGVLTGFEKNNYRWTFTLANPPTRWSLAASPLSWGVDGAKHFYVDETNVIRYSSVQATAAGPTSPPIE